MPKSADSLARKLAQLRSEVMRLTCERQAIAAYAEAALTERTEARVCLAAIAVHSSGSQQKKFVYEDITKSALSRACKALKRLETEIVSEVGLNDPPQAEKPATLPVSENLKIVSE